jgi:hypothetical protein
LSALLLLATLVQQSREVRLSDGPVELRVPVDAEAKHPATVVSLPETSLEALVAGWAEHDLSVERRGGNLFLKLLRKAEGDLHVLGASGALYRFSVRAAEEEYDGRVRVLSSEPEAGRPPEAVELIRAMRLGRRPREGRVLGSGTRIWSAESIEATALWVYDLERLRGFVVRVDNRSAEPRHLDAARFVGPDLVLAGCRENLLPPGGSTLLYLVFGRRP